MRFWGMLRFTIGETLRKGTLIFYFGVATCFLLFFGFGITRSASDPDIVLMFGMPLVNQSQPGVNIIEFVLIQLHSLSVFWILLFGIFGVAGLIPTMLEKGTIDLFLSKPLTRAELFMARAFGAISGITLNLLYFFVGIWLIFGLKAGVWHWGFLSSVIYVIYAFICYYSLVAFVGLVLRSTGFSILLAFAYSLISWVLEIREAGLYLIWNNNIYHKVLDAVYYLTPQLNAMLENSTRVVGKHPFILNQPEFTYMPFLYSFLSASLFYGLAIWIFSRRDY